MSNRFGIGLGIALGATTLGLSANTSNAQTLLSRLSEVSHSYVFGAGADSNVGDDADMENSLNLIDDISLSFQDATAGTLPGDPPSPYTAEVACAVTHEYSVDGSLREIRRIVASGVTDLSAPTSGAGIATMRADNPGNHLLFHFTVENDVPYHLFGSISHQGNAAFNSIILQRFDGSFWNLVQWTAFLPSGQGNFDYSGTLESGEYRIRASLGVLANSNEVIHSTYTYTLDVPGIGSCIADFDDGSATGTRDGGVDINDLLYFLTLFEQGDITADIDDGSGSSTPDDGVDINDLLYFLVRFEQGC